jgi:magnesium-transporting ATPase (P-type)
MEVDREPTVPKQLVMPIVATLVLIASITCFMCWSFTWSEFHHFEQVVEKEKSEFPYFCVNYQRAGFLNLVIPFTMLVWAGRLLREEHCPVRQLVWFVCGSVLALFLWVTTSFLAVYILNLKFYRFM